jgi:hypothetical protein
MGFIAELPIAIVIPKFLIISLKFAGISKYFRGLSKHKWCPKDEEEK